MRYRREEKRMVERMRTLTHPINSTDISNATTNNNNNAVDTSVSGQDNPDPQHVMTASQIVDETILAVTNTTSPGTTSTATKCSNHSTNTAQQSQTKRDDTTTTSSTTSNNSNGNNDTANVSADLDDDYANAVGAAVLCQEPIQCSPIGSSDLYDRFGDCRST